MRILRIYRKEILLGLLLFVLPFFIPQFGASDNTDVLVTAVSTLFAIVAGFFMADAMSNYLRLQTLIALENGTLIALAHAAREISPTSFMRLHDAIDAYMIAQLNVESLDHVLTTEPRMKQIVLETDALIRGAGMGARWEATHEMLKTIHVTRQEIALVAKENLSFAHWAILSILSTLLMLTVLSTRDGSLLINVIAGFMIVGSYSVLVLLRDVDSNRLLEQKLSFKNPTMVFDAIEVPPYFPHFTPPHLLRSNRDGVYRMGTLPGAEVPYVLVADEKAHSRIAQRV